MPAGRPPKPLHLHVVEGTYRKHRHDRRLKGESRPAGTLREPPEWLSPEQKVIWADALRHAPVGLLKPLDGPHLATWVVACDIHRVATTMLNALLSGLTGQRARVLVGIISGQARVMLKLGADLGFSPVSRTRVTVDPRPAANPFDDFA